MSYFSFGVDNRSIPPLKPITALPWTFMNHGANSVANPTTPNYILSAKLSTTDYVVTLFQKSLLIAAANKIAMAFCDSTFRIGVNLNKPISMEYRNIKAANSILTSTLFHSCTWKSI